MGVSAVIEACRGWCDLGCGAVVGVACRVVRGAVGSAE